MSNITRVVLNEEIDERNLFSLYPPTFSFIFLFISLIFSYTKHFSIIKGTLVNIWMESDLTWKSYSKTNSSIAFDLRQQKQAATKKQKSPTRPESLCKRCRLLSFDSNAQYEHDSVTLGDAKLYCRWGHGGLLWSI